MADAVERNIIVIGASAGGVEALIALFSHLPSDFDASVFVVLHTRYSNDSHLPEILNRTRSIRAHHPKGSEPVQKRRAYIAPNDLHMILDDSKVALTRAPRENCTRPAIDPLFRSAALAYGSRVIGVVLTGVLDDGTAGLWEIKRRGGIAIVQSPEDAMYPGMPTSAIANVHVDYIVPLSEIADLLVALCKCEART